MSPSGYDALVWGLVRTGRLDEAVMEYRDLVRKVPHSSVVRARFGGLLAMHGTFDEALAQLKEAIRLDPDDALAHQNLANALTSRGRLEEAAAAWREVIRTAGDAAPIRVALALIRLERGDRVGARADVRALSRLRSEDAAIPYQAALLLLATDRDGAGYREVASDVLDRPGRADGLWVDFYRARAGVLAPGVTDHPETLVALAENAVARAPREPWRPSVLGPAEQAKVGIQSGGREWIGGELQVGRGRSEVGIRTDRVEQRLALEARCVVEAVGDSLAKHRHGIGGESPAPLAELPGILLGRVLSHPSRVLGVDEGDLVEQIRVAANRLE
jgi:tetratricopeptide (TPR) repeat protein